MNRTLLLSALALLAAGTSPALAIHVPQTRQEFKKEVASGRGTTETYTVDAGVDAVFRLLREKSSTCLDVEVKRVGYVGYTEVSYSDYNPTVRRAGPAIEFALQVVHRPRAIGEDAPPGGLYLMVADIKPAGPRRSEVVLYRPNMAFKKIVNSFKEWSSGEDTPCPKMK